MTSIKRHWQYLLLRFEPIGVAIQDILAASWGHVGALNSSDSTLAQHDATFRKLRHVSAATHSIDKAQTYVEEGYAIFSSWENSSQVYRAPAGAWSVP